MKNENDLFLHAELLDAFSSDVLGLNGSHPNLMNKIDVVCCTVL